MMGWMVKIQHCTKHINMSDYVIGGTRFLCVIGQNRGRFRVYSKDGGGATLDLSKFCAAVFRCFAVRQLMML